MKLKKLSPAVSIYVKPVFGTANAKQRVMALAVDKKSKDPYLGIAREITESKGHPDMPGFLDKSKLIIIKSNDLLSWEKLADLNINGINQIINELDKDWMDFIGLEDPDIWNESGTKHVYFTIAYRLKNSYGYAIHLGHAQGKTLDSLIATIPVLSANISEGKVERGFKEVAISPLKNKNCWLMLNESGRGIGKTTITVSSTGDLGKPWKFIKTVMDPKDTKYEWCQGDLSPVVIFDPNFIKYDNLLVGLINGRAPDQIVERKRMYGKFRPGLILFNPKNGEIPWIASEPLLEDPDATTITFASDFIQTNKNEGILYCHVNDSFVRAYKINSKELKKLLPKEIK